MPQKLKILILAILLLAPGLLLVGPQKTFASPLTGPSLTFAATKELGNGCVGQQPSTCLRHNAIVSRLNEAVNILSGLVAIVVAGSIIVGGIQYAVAEDNPQKVGAARARILHAIIALIVFVFIYAILQWLIPGGVFGP